jgi:hypothetical protein
MQKALQNVRSLLLALAAHLAHSVVAPLIQVAISVRALMDTEDEPFKRAGN